jgi:hypothetical protein
MFLAAFLVPLGLMWLIYIAMEVWPFGENSVLVLDLLIYCLYIFFDFYARNCQVTPAACTFNTDIGPYTQNLKGIRTAGMRLFHTEQISHREFYYFQDITP